MTRGLALIEIVVVVAIIGLTVFSLYELVVLSRATTSRELHRVQALSLAQEGLEATRTIRDQGWSSTIANLTSGATYYVTLSGSTWQLTSTNPGPINGLFTRMLVFADVTRDNSGNISGSGSLDENTRKVTTTVTWEERGNNRSLELATYITNFLEN